MTHPNFTKLEIALAEIGNAVYAATTDVETMEHRGDVACNGHHLRQRMALSAQVLLYDSWADADEKAALSPTHPVHDALRQ